MNKHELIHFERELLSTLQTKLAQATKRYKDYKALTHTDPPAWMLSEIEQLRDQGAELAEELEQLAAE